jgi:phospholipid/cholesterol/gamma-HCH transport system substrate-binding protein
MKKAAGILMRRPVLSGLVLIAVAVLAGVLLFQKPAIITMLTRGETVTVQLARDYKVEPYATPVKMAGTKVGVVSGVERNVDPSGPARVLLRLKLHHGTRALLGTEPSAEIRPTTVLGGAYYVELRSGGDKGTGADVIPVQRTALPVELDRLLSALPADARQGLRGMVERLDSTLGAGAGAPLNQLLADAPATLRPAGVVLDAVRGVNKDTDLASMVSNLNKTAHVLSAKPGQLRAVVDSLAGTARVLGEQAGPVDRTIATMPDTLRAARIGADDLAVTLDKVTDTAKDIRPSVQALDPLLRGLDPTLARLRPVVADLRPLLEDAEPTVHELIPTVSDATAVLDDLNGPVLERVNGPILRTINTEWHGLAPKYPQGGGTGNKFYEELGYMFAHINNGVRYYNATAHLLGFQPGAGTTSVQGTGVTAQRLQDYLSEMYGPPHHRPAAPLGPRLPQGVAVPDPGLTPPVVAVPDVPGGTHR